MAKIKLFDEKSVKNRNRVRKHRYNKYLKKVHNDKINERIEKLNFRKTNFDVDNPLEQREKSDSDDSNEFKNKLRIWALNHRITRAALNELLMILISVGFSFLPKDSRTLMATPVTVPIEIMTNGRMWYNGIQKCLESVLSKVHREMKITLDFNVDGFPISKSSSKQFWPILASIQGKLGPFK